MKKMLGLPVFFGFLAAVILMSLTAAAYAHDENWHRSIKIFFVPDGKTIFSTEMYDLAQRSEGVTGTIGQKFYHYVYDGGKEYSLPTENTENAEGEGGLFFLYEKGSKKLKKIGTVRCLPMYCFGYASIWVVDWIGDDRPPNDEIFFKECK